MIHTRHEFMNCSIFFIARVFLKKSFHMTSYSNKTVARTFFSTYFTILNTMSIVNIRTIWKHNSIIGPDDIVQCTTCTTCV